VRLKPTRGLSVSPVQIGQTSSKTGQLQKMMFLSSASEAPLVSIVREGKQVDGPIHQHLEGQLIFPQLGVLILELDNKVIRLAPDRAAWIPSNVLHAVILNQTYRYHSVYVDPAFFHGPFPQILKVRPLFRELILDAESWFRDPGRRTADQGRAEILIDEMRQAVHLNRVVEIPQERRLTPICRAIEANPADKRPLRTWSRIVGASEKTIQRLFHIHTGLSFQQWRHYVRMARSLELQYRGGRLIDIAIEIGYANESAFAQAYKKFYGHSPSWDKRQEHALSR
jgi:AraC-like DNA-binding protein